MMNRKLQQVLVSILLLALLASGLLTACKPKPGQVTSPLPETPSAPPSPAPGEPVPVGVLLPAIGPLAWVSNSIPAIEMAVEEINAAGGAAGHLIELSIEDSEGETTAATAGATKLLDVDEVVALIGPTSLTILSVMPLAQERGVVAISPTAGTTALDTLGGEHVFRTVSSDVVMGAGMTWHSVNELGAKKVALFFADTGSAVSVGDVLRKAAEVLGLEIVADVTYVEGASTYRSELLEVRANSPDVIFFEGGTESAVVFFEEKTELELEGTWVGTDYVNDPFAVAIGDAGEGTIGVNPAPVITDRFNEWKANLEQKRGEAGAPTFSANAYDAMVIIALAMEAAGEPTREGIVANLRQVANPPGELAANFAQGKALLAQGKDIDYEGIAGAQDFNDFGDVVTSLQVVVVEDGKLERIGALAQDEIGDTIQQVLESIGQR